MDRSRRNIQRVFYGDQDEEPDRRQVYRLRQQGLLPPASPSTSDVAQRQQVHRSRSRGEIPPRSQSVTDSARRQQTHRARERGELSPVTPSASEAARWQRTHRDREEGLLPPVQFSDTPRAVVRRTRRKKAKEPLDLSLHDCGKMDIPCKWCLGLCYPNEKCCCCADGKFYMVPIRDPPKYLLWLLTSDARKAREFRESIVRYNTGFSFACRKFIQRAQPEGRGEPVVKFQGSNFFIASGLFCAIYHQQEDQPLFGICYTYDAKEAASIRMSNPIQGPYYNREIIRRLSREFAKNNKFADHLKTIRELIDEQDLTDEQLNNYRVQIKARYEVPEGTTTTHPGRLNVPVEKEFVTGLCEVNSNNEPLNNYGYWLYGRFHEKHPPYAIPSFSMWINPLCYPMIHPYGSPVFADSTLPLNHGEKVVRLQPEEEVEWTEETIQEELRDDFEEERRRAEVQKFMELDEKTALDALQKEAFSSESEDDEESFTYEEAMDMLAQDVVESAEDDLRSVVEGFQNPDSRRNRNTGSNEDSDYDDPRSDEDYERTTTDDESSSEGSLHEDESDEEVVYSEHESEPPDSEAEFERSGRARGRAMAQGRRRSRAPERQKPSGLSCGIFQRHQLADDDHAPIVEDEEQEDLEQRRAREEENRLIREAAEREMQGTLPADDEEDDQPDPEDAGDENYETFLGGRPHKSGRRKYASALQWLRFFLGYRKHKRGYHPVYSTGRLSQHYIIDNYCRIVEKRLHHVRMKFTEFQSSTKKKFLESLQKRLDNSRTGRKVGMCTRVPSNFVGSTAYYRQKFEDTMAMVQEKGKPDLFITFTGNKNWKEIQDLKKRKDDSYLNHPVAVARIFDLKLKELLHLLTVKQIFGKVKCFAYSVECQQRGMLHVHMLLTLADEDKLDTIEKIDAKIKAVIPPEPEEGDPDYDEKLRLRQLVTELMVHTPCEGNDEAYCRKSQKKKQHRCSKWFPHSFQETTTCDGDGYVQYKRPAISEVIQKTITVEKDGVKTTKTVRADNRHVVAYSPELLLRFGTHINVEVCSTVKAIKYIFKYIYKGPDKLLAEFLESSITADGTPLGQPDIQVTRNRQHILPSQITLPNAVHRSYESRNRRRMRANGVDAYQDGQKTLVYDETVILKEMQATGPMHAAWGILQLPFTRINIAVVRLSVHEEDEEVIVWRAGTERQKAHFVRSGQATSQLTAWMKLNQEDPEAHEYTYAQLPKFYKYDRTNKRWIKRKKNMEIIPRIYFVSARYMNKFAIRELVHVVKGAMSFQDLRTLDDGTLCATFAEAAQKRGLMNNEREWRNAMAEASQFMMPRPLRQAFAAMLSFGVVKNAVELWEEFQDQMLDRGRGRQSGKIARALKHINSILKHSGLSLDKFGLSGRGEDAAPDLDDVEPMDTDEAADMADELEASLNDDQRKIYNRLVGVIQGQVRRRCFYVDGPGGTGKTFLYKALYYRLLAMGKQALMVAHTGIAATLLINGTTVHRQFGIPLNTDEASVSKLQPDSEMVRKIIAADVIIWDEATMSDKRVYMCVDRLLRHLCNPNEPFGGKVMLLGGDWRQLLPVVRTLDMANVVNYTLKRCHLWRNFHTLKLTENMRAEDPKGKFADYIRLLGEADDSVMNPDELTVQLPSEICLETEQEVVNFVYGGDVEDIDKVKKVGLLTTENKDTEELNEMVLNMKKGQLFTFKSIDSAIEEYGNLALPPQFYNEQLPSGLPPHVLKLKEGCIVILLRNIDVTLGLCNGTRLRVDKIGADVLLCTRLTDEETKPYGHKDYDVSKAVILTRLPLQPPDKNDPTERFTRLQFPIRLAYCMTVNRAQGQTLKKVGLVLRKPPFSHGQLYVALSRVSSFDGVRVCQRGSTERDYDDNLIIDVRNVVYKEILH